LRCGWPWAAAVAGVAGAARARPSGGHAPPRGVTGASTRLTSTNGRFPAATTGAAWSPHPQMLQAALAEARAAAPHPIPLVINGRPVHPPPPTRVAHAIPHDTVAPPISLTSSATPAHLAEAAAGAAAAWRDWSTASQADRSAVFLAAAHLLGTDAWRWRVAAAAVLAMGKSAWQAEIDAVAEAADFWRFGVAAAEDLGRRMGGVGLPAEGGGLIQPHGEWNWCEARPLEGFVACMSPFKYVVGGGWAGGRGFRGDGGDWGGWGVQAHCRLRVWLALLWTASDRARC